MTMKKRIFWSNTVMVLVSLIIMLAVFTGIISLFKNQYMQSLEQRIELPQGLYQVQTLLESLQADTADWEALGDAVEEVRFTLHVEDSAGQVAWSNAGQEALHAVYALDEPVAAAEPVRVYTLEGITVAKRAVLRNGEIYTVSAVFCAENRAFGGMTQDMFQGFLAASLVTGGCTIAALLLCSQCFTRLLIRKIMEPVEALNLAALRIRDGNLEEAVHYTRQDEFQEMCDTFNLMQRDLKAGREQTAAYEKARTEMISGISHDLRTPLTAIKGFLKGILDGVANTPEKQVQYLRVAYQKAGEIEVLLQKLFFFSKLETGNMPLDCRPVELGGWLADMVAEKQEEASAGGYALTFQGGTADCTARVDVEQMRRVFDNLIENSVKYAETPHLQISVTLAREADRLRITFRDNGRGLAAEKLPHVFEQFYRGDEARNTKKEGSGLGLYVCRYIINAHGGTIRAESNGGFLVEIELPAAAKEGQDG